MTSSTPFTALAPGAHVQEHTKRRLLVLSRSLEARVHQAGADAIVLATFQHDAHLTRRSTAVYTGLAGQGHRVAVYAVPHEDAPAHPAGTGPLHRVALGADDPIVREWNVVVIGRHASYALAAQEVERAPGEPAPDDLDRRFRWTVTEQRAAAVHAAHLLLRRGPHLSWLLPAAAA